MTLALVVLALIWAAVLVPPVIRARSEGRPADSISAFRRQLTVLRRTRPQSTRGLVPDRPRAHAYVPGSAAPVTSLAARRSMTTPGSRPRPVGSRALVAAGLPTSRARTLRRRRDVFVVLLATAAATLVMSLVPALRVLLYVHLATDVLLGAYVALLIRQRGAAAELEMKVRFLPAPAPEPMMYRRAGATEPALYRRSAGMEPALLRRSAGMEPALLRRSAGMEPALLRRSAGMEPALLRRSAN
ncbi:MAG TPA: hypothetical protein VHS52_06985 [Acidimicrobiales bacterium]|nr:hypothetical protein [Acidimicrobiales bacterium]